ncbi:TPA: hypothetical protein I7721_19310, partial [Vibrio vulnificus]|nr:hypothetical protein [Vibrio vulnificus]
MFGLDNKSGINVMPPIAPADSQSPLWFTEGGAGLSATYPGQDWFNQIQAELINVVIASGLTLDKGKLNQLSESIKKLQSDNCLTKDQNGADIPDKPKFIENLGLPEMFQPKGDYQAAGNYADGVRFVAQEVESLIVSPDSNIAMLVNNNKTTGVWDKIV